MKLVLTAAVFTTLVALSAPAKAHDANKDYLVWQGKVHVLASQVPVQEQPSAKLISSCGYFSQQGKSQVWVASASGAEQHSAPVRENKSASTGYFVQQGKVQVWITGEK
jgi:hypothetical protein